MNTEEDLQHLFRSTTDDLDFAVADVISGGTQRGRRLRRRRTTTAWVGGLATAAVVAPLAWVGSAALTSDGTPGDGDSLVATAPRTVEKAVAAPRVPAFDDAGVADELASILAEVVPDMSVETTPDDHSMNRSASRASAVLTDAAGKSSVEVQIWPAEEGRSAGDRIESFCEDPDSRAECSEVDGGTLAVQESSWDNNRGEAYLDNVIDFITDDGLRVRATSSNNVGVALETLSPERPEAPLTLEQTIEIATDSRWVVVGETPEPPAQLAIRDLSVTTVDEARERLTALVRDVLPDAEITDAPTEPSGMDLYAAVLVDDGDGPSYVSVFLQHAADDYLHSEFLNGAGLCGEGCTEDERGRLDLLENDNDGKEQSTGVQNMANLQRADGAYVGVSSSNTPVSQYVATSTSRTAPLLSTKQLAKIARSDAWVE